ncbi:NAD(P)/FAD-dependent oxidoreductase [Sphingomonas solaris]|uniref:NAD(P)/FAD-dependent oxidoreductase n=1 Tax=Alterirhizorhabdus solaris TaxID=2529389 RepID=A0A558R1F8_9SPHN|nr:NAD(P)/FAD-dependent oxidoreductase [Sphingomonas solaris]TVV73226.1 NAD(P)/FAD-dependent oxidoreductase [Sphingomonas solaris]
MKAPTPYDAIIIGAGAAGLMAAFTAGQRGRRVLLLDHAEKAGKKILISGGGRCNFTNRDTAPDRFLSANPHFAKSALGRYTATDFVALVERHGIAWHEKTLGQLFCDGSARAIVAMLLGECEIGGVDIRLDHAVTAIDRPDDFRIATPHGSFTAPSLVIATGGPSIPKMGATGFAYDVARRFGLKVVEPRPALVPLTLGEPDMAFRALSGVAVPAVARCGRAAFPEAALFTHRGLSGPAILQISSYWRNGEAITLDMLPGHDAATALLAAKRARPRAQLRTVLAELLPARLADTLATPGNLADLPDKTLAALGTRLNGWSFTPSGSEGYAKAEVTVGGVDTAGLNQKTMAAKAVPGLHFVGEAVDVTGWLGGYNFQWAWASGWSAGQVL